MPTLDLTIAGLEVFDAAPPPLGPPFGLRARLTLHVQSSDPVERLWIQWGYIDMAFPEVPIFPGPDYPTDAGTYSHDYPQAAGNLTPSVEGFATDLMSTWSDSVELTLRMNEAGPIRFGGRDVDNAVIATAHADRVSGNAGQDYILGQAGADTLFGGADSDTLLGGAGHDFVLGGDDGDRLLGDAGDDDLRGQSGADTMLGGVGHDMLRGGDHDDVLNGEAGNDTLFGDADHDSLSGGSGADVLWGGDGNDTLRGANEGVESDGILGADLLRGDAGNDLLDGAGGNDTLGGGSGADTMLGGEGADRLNGGSGADWFQGGEGLDVLTSAADGAKDSFYFGLETGDAIDRITGFEDGIDRIVVLASPEAVLQLGSSATGAGPVILYDINYGNALLYDADGAGGMAATPFARIVGGASLSLADFVLVG